MNIIIIIIITISILTIATDTFLNSQTLSSHLKRNNRKFIDLILLTNIKLFCGCSLWWNTFNSWCVKCYRCSTTIIFTFLLIHWPKAASPLFIESIKTFKKFVVTIPAFIWVKEKKKNWKWIPNWMLAHFITRSPDNTLTFYLIF